MNLTAGRTIARLERFAGSESGFTLVEVMVASTISIFVVAAAIMFTKFGGLYVSGITAQATLNQQAGNAIEFIQSRVRLATSVTSDASGNWLTLSFDDNPEVDSDGNGKTYDDRDHYERFSFIGANGSTNTAATNKLVYIADITNPSRQVLISAGVHNLPGFNIFTVTNQATAIIRFDVVDGYSRDRYQGLDIQATAVPMNRPTATNFVGILP